MQSGKIGNAMTGGIYARYFPIINGKNPSKDSCVSAKPWRKRMISRMIRTYIVCAVSAKTDNCPDFHRMIKDSEKGMFDAVIVWNPNCFARTAHYKDSSKTITFAELEKSGFGSDINAFAAPS